MSHPNTQHSWRLFKRLIPFIKAHKTVLMLGVLANISFVGIDAFATYLIKPLMDKSFIEQDVAFVKQIPIVLFFGITLRGLILGFGGYCMTYVSRAVVTRLRQRLFSHLLRLPVPDYDKFSSGTLLSKLLYDVEQVSQVSADALTTFIQSVFLVTGLLLVMFALNWQLSSLFLLISPFVSLVVLYTNRRTRIASKGVQTSMGDVTAIAGEAVQAYQSIRVYGGESYEEERFVAATELARRKDMKVAKAKVINVSGVPFLIAIGVALCIFGAMYLAPYITITPGAFVSLIAAMLQLIKPMKNLTVVNSTIQRGLAGAESLFSILDRPIEKDSGPLTRKVTNADIRFDNVSFAYQADKPVLKSINLTIKKGEAVALVGHSGGGKSTLVNLIPRFYLPTSGRILIDGVDINEIELGNLREHIALVSQHIVLFNDTIRNNIAYANPDASIDDIWQAAKQSYAEEFILKLPQGLDTLIGENGLMLSGGQRQRLAIARAMLKDAPILILDEATSALDNHTEEMIKLALNNIMQHRTTIVIAHRLSTVRDADRIMVIEQGQLVEQGAHDALVQQGGIYAQMIAHQDGRAVALATGTARHSQNEEGKR